MKKLLHLLLAATLVVASLTACAKNNNVVTETTEVVTEAVTEAVTKAEPQPSETETSEQTEEIIGLPNPIVAVKDSGEFYDKLGIMINASRIDDDVIMNTISDEIAEVCWRETNVNGEDVNFTFRATKNAEIAESLPGVYDEKMTDPVKTEVPLTDTKTVTIRFTEAPTEGYGIYTWKDGQIYYSLTYDKDMSQMALAEILDSIMDATGIRYHNQNMVALPTGRDFSDAIWHVDFDKNAFKKQGDDYYIECDLFSEEYFDAVEVSLLQVGDTITIEGDMMYEITSIERNTNGGDIIINGGVDEGGFVLTPAEGGTYRVRELDDMMTFSYCGKKVLELDDDVVLTDTADIENHCEEKVVRGADAVIRHLKNNAYIYPSHFSTMVRLDDGEIEEIRIVYVP